MKDEKLKCGDVVILKDNNIIKVEDLQKGDNKMYKGKGENIIELLKDEDLEINQKLANTINMLAYENYEKAKDKGIEEGIKIGLKRAYSKMKDDISTMESKIDD